MPRPLWAAERISSITGRVCGLRSMAFIVSRLGNDMPLTVRPRAAGLFAPCAVASPGMPIIAPDGEGAPVAGWAKSPAMALVPGVAWRRLAIHCSIGWPVTRST